MKFSSLVTMVLAERTGSYGINNGSRDMRDVVREDIQRNVGDRLHDLAIRQTRSPSALEVRVAYLATLNDDRSGEFQKRIGARIGGARADRICDLLRHQPRLLTEKRVSAHGVRAQVTLRHRKSDLLAESVAESSSCERFSEVEVTLQRNRGVHKNSEDVWDEPEFF